ncbi:hypothetical protein P9139_05735 [Curtobacterium flaccumfaciens]|nr:hypothetical protein P9139_05735 [Curtobacterium flaccumfaciens]
MNLGGLSLGALVGGALAEFVGQPLMVPYVVFVVALAVAFVVVLAAPETVDRPSSPVAYRPQRLQAPEGKGVAFWAAGTAAFAALAVQGLFTSVAPTFLGTTFHMTDRLAAGATTFGRSPRVRCRRSCSPDSRSVRRSGSAWCCSSAGS